MQLVRLRSIPWVALLLATLSMGSTMRSLPAEEPKAKDAAEGSPSETPEPKPEAASPEASHRALLEATSRAAQGQDWTEMARLCAEGVRVFPRDPLFRYNLACAAARLGRAEEALEHLERSVELGFRDAEHILADPDLESLRSDDRRPALRRILERARALGIPGWERATATPGPIEDGVAMVRPENTAWDPATGTFRALFAFGDPPPKDAPAVRGQGEAGARIREWYAEGTAAGNRGDLYDNRDGDHSNLSWGDFPQLARIEYSEEAVARRLHYGLTAFLFDGIVLGNASIAATAGPAWRSMPRMIHLSPRHLAIAVLQYRRNHLYVYPEHRDHDPADEESETEGLGDLYSANTPYAVASQGSSGSDVAFLNALACTLAALRPDVKGFLAGAGAISPTLQLILRSSLTTVESPEGYLTGRAHPSVFSGNHLDPARMVRMAHDLRKETVPPLVEVRAVEEDAAALGVDCFDPAHGVRLFDTPCAIARVLRSVKQGHRIVVSAEGSRDPNGAKLSWHWVVLRGDADRIGIRPLNDQGSVVELTVPWHGRRPILPGGRLESSRVDVGAFVHNGTWHSAPAFVTFYFLNDETREYAADGRILSVDYTKRGPYEDPVLSTPRTWRDEYSYDDGGRLLGWTRRKDGAEESFTAEGALVTKRDELGRPAEARSVAYSIRDAGRPGQAVEYAPGDEVLAYRYASPEDRRGEVASRTKASASGSAGDSAIGPTSEGTGGR